LRVTVVTPTLNQCVYLPETLRSVVAQNHPAEHIVIDGGSTDDTLSILGDSAITWISRPDSGQAQAINDGIRMATGDIVAWLNSDDTYLPGAIQWAIETFESNPGAGMIYGDTAFVDASGGLLHLSSSEPFDYARFVSECRNPIPQPSAFIRREAWLDLDESLHYFFDWDLWLRIGRNWPIIHDSQIISTYRLHDESKTWSSSSYAHELETVYLKSRITPLASMYARTAQYHANGGNRRAAYTSLYRALRHGLPLRQGLSIWRAIWKCRV